MKILSVSTATNFLTISLNEDEKVIKQVEEKDQRNHSEHQFQTFRFKWHSFRDYLKK